MKILGTGPLQKSELRRTKKSDTASSAAFGAELEGSQNSSQTGAAAASGPVSAASGLLSLQEAPDAASARSRGLARGHEMLDILEGIRRAILLGAIPLAQLRALADQARRQRLRAGDAALDALLADIELRAEVELAKFGQ